MFSSPSTKLTHGICHLSLQDTFFFPKKHMDNCKVLRTYYNGSHPTTAIFYYSTYRHTGTSRRILQNIIRTKKENELTSTNSTVLVQLQIDKSSFIIQYRYRTVWCVNKQYFICLSFFMYGNININK